MINNIGITCESGLSFFAGLYRLCFSFVISQQSSCLFLQSTRLRNFLIVGSSLKLKGVSSVCLVNDIAVTVCDSTVPTGIPIYSLYDIQFIKLCWYPTWEGSNEFPDSNYQRTRYSKSLQVHNISNSFATYDMQHFKLLRLQLEFWTFLVSIGILDIQSIVVVIQMNFGACQFKILIRFHFTIQFSGTIIIFVFLWSTIL